MQNAKTKSIYLAEFFLFAILLTSFCSAISQPTQQFSKIFLNPFYVSSSTQNIPTNFTLSLYPPDKINSVLSAIVIIDVWLNPSINFTLLVNGMPCNNPSYYISTTYASAGKNTIGFDCSNVITHSGIYTFSLLATKDTGALTGWLDFTYTNNPLGELALSGTEYSPNDLATIFTQVIDNQGVPVSNASCYLNIWNPLINGTHTYYAQDIAMIFNGNSDGLYYYDLTAPSTLGVYMLSAKCYVPSDINTKITDNFECDSFSCGTTNWNSSWITYGGSVDVTGTRAIENYALEVKDTVGEADRNFTIANCSTGDSAYINFWATTEGLENGKGCEYRYYNGTGYITLLNLTNLNSNPNDYRYYSFSVCQYTGTSGIKRFCVRKSGGGGKRCYLDNVEISLTTPITQTQYQTISGSSEMHIVNVPQSVIDLIGNITVNVNLTINYSQIASSVWSFVSRNLTYAPDLTNYNMIQTLVWNATNRNLTFYEDKTNYSLVANYVWNYTDRNLTYYQVNNLTADDVWNYVNRNLTFYQDIVNYSQITLNVWNYADRNLTYYQLNNITPFDIWNFQNRTLTQNISQEVWLFSNRTLSYYPTNNISVQDIWDYVNRSLTTDIPFEVWNYNNRTLTQNISFEVWTYNNRSLTYYPIVDLSQIPFEVWNYTIRNLTYYMDTTNYTQSAQSVWSWSGSIFSGILSYFSQAIWNSTDRNLTYYPFSNINYSQIAEYVWTYNNRSLTFYEINNITASDIWNFMNRNLTFYEVNNLSSEDIWTFYNRTLTENISQQVWNYMDRNLTFYPINNMTIEDIWNYVNRSLTQDIPFEVWGYPNRNVTNDFAFEVWQYYNRTLTFYPEINFTALGDFLTSFSLIEEPAQILYGNLSFSLLSFVESPLFNMTMYAPSYPYVDFNNTYLITLNPLINATIFITNSSNSTNEFNFTNGLLSLIFTQTGNYPFKINDSSVNGDIRGIFLVRVGFNVTICGYKEKTATKYRNEFAYLIAEFPTSKQYYDSTLEQFITPLLFSQTFKTPVFQTRYSNGCGTLHLWENDTYVVRLFDGQATFDTSLSVPNITQSYGTNIYLGKIRMTSNSTLFNVFLSNRDIKPYGWLFNWMLVIVIALALVSSIFIFFINSDNPSSALIFPLIIIIGAILLRGISWWFFQ